LVRLARFDLLMLSDIGNNVKEFVGPSVADVTMGDSHRLLL